MCSSDHKKSYINKINATLDKIGTSKVKSTPIELASIESGDKEIFTDQRKTEQVHVGQTYKESHNNINDISEEKVEMDTSFSNYKHNYQNKERSKFVKWSMRVIKVILLIMLLPLISIIGAAILTFLGCFIAGILGSIGVGVMLIGITSFFSTQISPMLIALGITSSITVLALGAILTILFIMMIKQIKKLTQKYRKTRKVSSREAR